VVGTVHALVATVDVVVGTVLVVVTTVDVVVGTVLVVVTTVVVVVGTVLVVVTTVVVVVGTVLVVVATVDVVVGTVLVVVTTVVVVGIVVVVGTVVVVGPASAGLASKKETCAATSAADRNLACQARPRAPDGRRSAGLADSVFRSLCISSPPPATEAPRRRSMPSLSLGASPEDHT
jgi:hypothetical protein